MAVHLRRGTWICDYYDHLGIRRTPSFGPGPAGKRAADLHYAETIKAKGDSGRYRGDPNVTLATYMEGWVTGYEAKPATIESYHWARLKVAKVIGKERVRDLGGSHVLKLAEGLRDFDLSRRSRKIVLTFLHTCLAYATAEGLLGSNPVAKVGPILRRKFKAEPGEEQRRIRAMTKEQLETFLEWAFRISPESYYPLYLCLSRTGMREGEAIGLQWGDIDLVGQRITIRRNWYMGRFQTPKGGRSRWVPIAAKLLDNLRWLWRAYRKPDDLVFPGSTGQPLDRSKVRKVMVRICLKAGLGHWTVHDLRHTFATILLSEGADPRLVQELLGHAALTTTEKVYGAWFQATKQRSAAAVELLGDEPSTLVANPVAWPPHLRDDQLQLADWAGGPRRDRTGDLLIAKKGIEEKQ